MNSLYYPRKLKGFEIVRNSSFHLLSVQTVDSRRITVLKLFLSSSLYIVCPNLFNFWWFKGQLYQNPYISLVTQQPSCLNVDASVSD